MLGGIISGYGQAARERNLLDINLKIDKQDKLAKAYEHFASLPDIPDDLRQEFMMRGMRVMQAPPGKVPKDLADLTPFVTDYLTKQTGKQEGIRREVSARSAFEVQPMAPPPGIPGVPSPQMTPPPMQFPGAQPSEDEAAFLKRSSIFRSPEEFMLEKRRGKEAELRATSAVKREEAQAEENRIRSSPEFKALPPYQQASVLFDRTIQPPPQLLPIPQPLAGLFPGRVTATEDELRIATQLMGQTAANQRGITPEEEFINVYKQVNNYDSLPPDKKLKILGEAQSQFAKMQQRDPTGQELLHETRKLNIEIAKRVLMPPGMGQTPLPMGMDQTVNSVADRILSGEIRYDQGLATLGGVRSGFGPALMHAIDEKQGRILPPIVRSQLADLNRGRELVSLIESVTNKVINSKSGEERVKNSLLLEELTGSLSTLFARAIYQERGATTDRDVVRARGLLPGWKAANFSPDFAQREIAILKDTINRMEGVVSKEYFKFVPKAGFGPPPGTEGQPNNALLLGKHKKTGEPVYSLDGGRTWQRGNPPQQR